MLPSPWSASPRSWTERATLTLTTVALSWISLPSSSTPTETVRRICSDGSQMSFRRITAYSATHPCTTPVARKTTMVIIVRMRMQQLPASISLTWGVTVGFANAILDGDDPGDNSIFYLPLGLGIPGGDRPKCKNCTKNIMATYANVASNGTLLISQTYPQAAQQINLGCGPGFVEANVEVEGSASGFARRLSPESRALAFLLATTAASLLLS